MKNISKKTFIILLTSAVLLLAIALTLIIAGLAADGGKSVEDALWEYEKGCMLYDSKRMVKYSSDYRRDEMAEGKAMTPSELMDYLDKSYSKVTSPYLQGKLGFTSSKKKYYDEGSERYAELLSEYGEHPDAGSIERFAEITAVITYNDVKVLKVNACLVKIGGRWFFYKNLL